MNLYPFLDKNNNLNLNMQILIIGSGKMIFKISRGFKYPITQYYISNKCNFNNYYNHADIYA